MDGIDASNFSLSLANLSISSKDLDWITICFVKISIFFVVSTTKSEFSNPFKFSYRFIPPKPAFLTSLGIGLVSNKTR